jgi:Ca2+-binding EF-hand superfamily protein
MTEGTIGDKGLSNQVISDIDLVMKQAEVKNAALQYFSKKITPNNFKELQNALNEKDSEGKGLVNSDDFIRCLSRSQMKCTEREVMQLVEELDKAKTGEVNYNEFLKFSYMCQMYIYHFKLENLL